MEHQERATTSHLSKEEDGSQPSGETHLGQPEAQSESGVCQDQRQPGSRVNDWELQQSHRDTLQMEFQDSNLSPALPLLSVTSEVEHNFTEYSFSQQSNPDFVPLRAYPDVSVASERFGVPPQDCTTHSMEHSSLSQYPLTQATILSEETAGSCFTPSQHSLSSENKTEDKEMSHLCAITDNEQGIQSREGTGSSEKESEVQTNLTDKQTGGAVDDEIFFLRKDVPAQHLLDLLQKEVGLRSSSSSAVSSEFQTSTKGTDESKNAEAGKPFPDESLVKREGPPGEASLFQKQTEQSDQSGALSSEISNITMGSRSTQPDDGSELLHRQLLSEAQRLSRLEDERKKNQQVVLTASCQLFTPSLRNVSERKPSGNTNLASLQWMGPLSPGAECTHTEQNLLPQSKTGYDGSYLSFLPQSQSTPGVGIAQFKPNVKTKLEQLSAIESEKENLYQSSTGITPQPAGPKVDAHLSDEANQCDKDALQTSAEVQFLPSLNYIQKIDAWRAKQNNSSTLEEFDGISSKNKAHDAISNPLNQILIQQAGTLRRPSVTGAANQTATHNSSSAPSGSSSPRRGEAVGGAPCDKDNRGSAAPPSPFGMSQSHSSLSTVVMSINKHQQTDTPPEEERTQSQDDASHLHHHHHSSTAVQFSPVVNLGHFSDVSFDQTLSSSQDSYSEVKVVASVGTSSVVSLELDHYAPYWTSKHSTPPPSKSQELNIDERIPLYLQNLGIDQTPSKILTPFAPRGPIREPEFSPTDLVTIKGSTGTPSRSTQPSEGGSPHKEEFSRSSILSVDSSVSIPFSLDSLGLAVSVPEQVRARMTSLSDIEAIQRESRLAPGSQPNEGFQFSSLQLSHQQRVGRQAVSHPDSDTSLTLKSRVVENNSDSPFQSSQSVDEDAENSFVSTNAVSEIRKLLSHAENIISTGSSAASSAALPNQLFSHQDIFKSPHPKTSRIQNSSFASSSADGDLRTRSSLLWRRSSSDSMLALEKTRQTSVGRESMTSSQQPNNPSTHAAATAPATVPYNMPQDSTVGSNVETSLAIAKSARRTEPEGCSAVPPDNIPTQPHVMKPSPASSIQQPNSPSSDRGGVSEEDESSSPPAAQSRSSSSVIGDADQEAMSDGSSESSLTLRVAKLLQSESPATVMSSTPSVTDQEENKTKEWLKLNVLRQQRGLQELNIEDRKRIEEIKKELLLRNPLKSQGSTDTESSASSSLQTNKALNPPQSVKTFFTLTDVDNQHRLSLKHPESHTQPQSTHHSDLEALVCEIAAREGVTLATKQPRTFTCITTSPSPSTSSAPPASPAPLPLHVAELSTEPNRPLVTNQSFPPLMDADEDAALAQTNREQPSVYEAGNSFQSRNQSVTCQSNLKNQKRQDTEVGQSEELPSPTQDLDKTDANIQPYSAPSFSHYKESSNHSSFVSGVGQKPNQAAGPGSTARPVHVSNVHPSLYPKATHHTSESAAGLPQQLLLTPRDPASAASSPDEGVGSSSPLEWYHREPERPDTFNMFKTVVAQRQATAAAAAAAAASTQSFIRQHKTEATAGSPSAETPVPVLLPYKPRGSEELFYVPQTEADVSSAEQSDTTMESTHTGSDDAVPPHFSSDVLGSKDPGLDRGVTFRHAEGIYSKRLKAVTFKMQSPELRVDASAAAAATHRAATQTLKTFTTFTPSPPQNHKISTRDQGTSPVQYPQYRPPETSHERFHRLHVETVQPPVSQRRGERDLSQLDPAQSSRTLDHLWQRFCNQWTAEVSRPARDREASLLMRLERLSRLLHHTKADTQEGRGYHVEEPLRRTQRNRGAHQELRGKHDVFTEAEGTVSEPHIHDGHASSSSHSASQTLHLSPADRDESETSSAVSGSMSTVDTARLIRAFGPHRVQHLKSSSSLSKLYGTINKQQEERERNTDGLHDVTPSHTGTDESVAPDSSSPSSSMVPSHHGPSRALTAKRKVKLVNKSVQTGDLEIVRNGTRRHTRDVGTTFPSPGEAKASGQISSSSSNTVRGRGGRKSLSKAHSIQMQRKNKRSPSKPYPKGVSWFISADSLRSETRKENRPAACWSQSMAWFEPYSRVSPWRAPLRQKQLHEDRDHQSCLTDPPEPDPAPKTRAVSSGITRVSLQESLELHRPEFISRSRQRVMHLALQGEERRLQADFIRERNLFNQPRRPTRLPKPAGTALLKRAVPRKEMIQRSKQIYETLPEVRERREEEQRKAEYQSYRQNAQLYNKRITNRVLGRRAAWH